MISCENCNLPILTHFASPFMCSCGHRTTFKSKSTSTTASVPRPVTQPRGKVGTELAKIIPRLFRSKSCPCQQYANKMDTWGIKGCESKFNEILDHLVAQASTKPLIKYFPGVNRAVATSWLTSAIERAKANLATSDPRPSNGDWFVAMTTAPRKDCTLLRSIESLRLAGWEPTVFAEPGSTPSDAETIWHDQKKGVWHNWLASARHAIDNTKAKLILTVQDDSYFHPDSRWYTESILWPAKSAGFVSLYTPKHYSFGGDNQLKPPGVNRVVTVSLWGACALVWPRKVLEQVINSPLAATWIGARPRSGSKAVMDARRADPSRVANSDTAIGQIVNSMRRTMWFVDPSPVSHIAVHSTISHGDNSGRRNCVRCADPAIPLVEQAPPRQRVNLE